MKNLKTIAATMALTSVLAINSFAGIIVTDAVSQPKPCENQKTGIIVTFTGIILTFTGIIVTFSDNATSCTEAASKGVMIAD